MTISSEMDVALRLAVAGLGGLAVGIEREWSGRVAERVVRFAGVRTFLLLGLIGGICAELQHRGQAGAGVAVLGAAALLAVVAYGLKALKGDVDGTTEVAALLVLGAGFLSGLGMLGLASGLFAITALVLVEKSRMHSLVERIQSQTLEAGARFAVLALVILPLLPAGPYGPDPGFRPRELWALVLIFSGLSFAGYLALRITGPGSGYGLAGLFGGLISSTVVSLNFSRESREQPAFGRLLALGVIAACTVLPIRTGLLAGALNADVARRALPFLLIPMAVGTLMATALLRRREAVPAKPQMPDNPLRLVAAIQLALLFQVVLYVVHWVQGAFGSTGVFASAALVGFTDMDSLTYSMVKLGSMEADAAVAARALGIGVLSNTVLKALIVLVIGRGAFRTLAGAGLGALVLASAAALLLF
jgi:uncharacterized membrane protein (DUF4010 family)